MERTQEQELREKIAYYVIGALHYPLSGFDQLVSMVVLHFDIPTVKARIIIWDILLKEALYNQHKEGETSKAAAEQKLIEKIAEKYWIESYRSWSVFNWDKGFSEASNLARKDCLTFASGILALIKEAGYKSPEEIALIFNPDYLNFQKGVEVTEELYKDYVKLADDQTPPQHCIDGGCNFKKELKGWRKVEVKCEDRY